MQDRTGKYPFLTERIVEKVGLYAELLFIGGNLLQILELALERGEAILLPNIGQGEKN
jgi:hypothetical protein